MINPQAQAAQQQSRMGGPHTYSFGGPGLTPQNMLSTGTPHNIFGSASHHSSSAATPSVMGGAGVATPVGPGPVYAPCASPAPPSPATPMSIDR